VGTIQLTGAGQVAVEAIMEVEAEQVIMVAGEEEAPAM
jgi:hypothetical protein